MDYNQSRVAGAIRSESRCLVEHFHFVQFNAVRPATYVTPDSIHVSPLQNTGELYQCVSSDKLNEHQILP